EEVGLKQQRLDQGEFQRGYPRRRRRHAIELEHRRHPCCGAGAGLSSDPGKRRKHLAVDVGLPGQWMVRPANDAQLALEQFLGLELGWDIRRHGRAEIVEPAGPQVSEHVLIVILLDQEAYAGKRLNAFLDRRWKKYRGRDADAADRYRALQLAIEGAHVGA